MHHPQEHQEAIEVIVCTNFAGTITQLPSEKLLENPFYQSLYIGNDCRSGDLEPNTVKLLKKKFGDPPDYNIQDSGLLMRKDAIQFFQEALSEKTVQIHIITDIPVKYVQALFEFHHFDREEISRLKIHSPTEEKNKGAIVSEVLKNPQAKNPTLFILDNNEDDFKLMTVAAQGAKKSNPPNCHFHNINFQWNDYLKKMRSHLLGVSHHEEKEKLYKKISGDQSPNSPQENQMPAESQPVPSSPINIPLQRASQNEIKQNVKQIRESYPVQRTTQRIIHLNTNSEATSELIKKLMNYKKEREPKPEYIKTFLGKGLGFSKTEKIKAVSALMNALNGRKTDRPLIDYLPALKNGEVGKTIINFLQKNQYKNTNGVRIASIPALVKYLESKLPQDHPCPPNPKR